MVEKLKKMSSSLFGHLHHRTPATRQEPAPWFAVSPESPVADPGDQILHLDQEHWDEAQRLLVQHDAHDSQIAKFALGKPQNFA